MGMFDDAMNNYTNFANSLMGIYGGVKGVQTANNVNNQVQSGLNQNQAAVQSQIDALNGTIAQNRQQAQDMYQRSLADVTNQNNGLTGDIDTQTKNLQALSDPNSAYMQQARQAIERKDAAAGRNSQWGDRETQLAGTLAQYVSQYSPAMQQSITQARNQINQNNQGLASLYSTANAPADRNTMSQMAALQQQLQNIQAANTTGRNSANAATNALTGTGGLTSNIGNWIKGLGGLFGGGAGTPESLGIANYFGSQGSVDQGITGYGSGIGDLYGTGIGSMYDGQSYGYGSLPAADYFGGGGFGGTPMDFSGIGFGSSSNDYGDY